MRRLALLLAISVVIPGCTATGNPADEPTPTTQEPSSPPPVSPRPSPTLTGPPLELDVVTARTGPDLANDRTYLDGMELAVDEVNGAGGIDGRPLGLVIHDDRGDPAEAGRLIEDVLAKRPVAILVVGPAEPLAGLRDPLSSAGVPVALLGGDAYTARTLFPQVFQVTVPWVWQAHAIARYLVTDRRARDVVFAGSGPGAEVAAGATRGALEYWGGSLSDAVTYPSLNDPPEDVIRRAAAAEATVIYGAPADSVALARALHAAGSGRVVGGASLLVDDRSGDPLSAGTAACYVYTWAGWGEPIPRVRSFAMRFEAATGRQPAGLEQEGFDAVRILAEGLRATGGVGGPSLARALEDSRERTFAGFPIDFGPDDHVFGPRSELGLFAVPGPRERVDPWQEGGRPWTWRPVMRTFTYDGERTSVLERDRRIFFTSWRKDRPAPEYWHSRFGIVSGPEDPLH